MVRPEATRRLTEPRWFDASDLAVHNLARYTASVRSLHERQQQLLTADCRVFGVPGSDISKKEVTCMQGPCFLRSS